MHPMFRQDMAGSFFEHAVHLKINLIYGKISGL